MEWYRPKFRRNPDKWKKVITALRAIGIDTVYEAMENGQFAMVKTGETQDGEGNTKWQSFRLRNIEKPALEGMQPHKVWITPQGEVGKTYILKDSSQIAYTAMLEELRKEVKPLSIPKKPAQYSKNGMALEIMLPDHHFGKIAYGYTQETWTLEEARTAWETALASHLARVNGRNLERIFLPIGNDLLHTNSDMNTTKAGTPMEVSAIFSALYSFVRDVVTASILSLSEVAPVTVVMVGGNHDEDGIYRLGEWLEGRFHGADAVVIDNRPYRRKHNQFGKVLLSHMHGEKVNIRDIHNSITNDVPRLFAETKWRYVKIGHLHKSKRGKVQRDSDVSFVTEGDEYMGTDVEICPSLCPADKWHFDNLYTGNQRRSKAYLYDKESGKVEEFYFNL